MDCNDEGASFALNIGDSAGSPDAPSAVNSSVLNYYKKFGRKRDLEQFFSLSTAQSDIRDPRSAFWRRMKAPSDSSDSGDNRGKSESSLEVCRISIKCTVPEGETSRSQDPDNVLDKSESVSPPIVTEDAAIDTSHHTEEECVKSDGEHSQKSNDATLDTSMNKPFSPTSSITSQRKLEWDSLADVGYANEGDRKNSASSLSTLERLALKQQYSNNDTQPDNSKLGTPTAHSTPQEETDMKFKGKKAKSTKFHSRDVDLVEVNMPDNTQINPPQAISVNLTKHISFNVEKDGGVTVHNIHRDVSMKPGKVTVETEMTPQVKIDKEIQTSLKKTKDKSSSSGEISKNVHLYGHGVPVLINLNAMRKKTRKKKLRTARRKLQCKRSMNANKENLPVLEKSGEQVSEAESFEYMPGHIYNQNQLNNDQPTHNSIPDNKSSLESSGALTTTDSSKASKHSFTKDLEKSINLLKTALQSRYDDTSLKQRLIKEVVERLIKSNYRGDETTTDFLSGLSFSSKKLGLGESNQTTTSTSDANNTADKTKLTRPKKSILRSDKFNSNAMRSTSQSAPNLPCASKSDLPITSSFRKPIISSTNTESDVSSKDKLSSDPAVVKTSSEELYNKYLNALKREQAYKKHLREKEMFLKQKLGSSESVLKFPVPLNSSTQNRVKDLMKDLTRNNYDDGSGDASKLEVGSSSYINPQRYSAKPQRSHSVFTLSSGGSSCQYNKLNPRKDETKKSPRATHSKNEHYCCCPYHTGNTRMGVTDSSVQVDLNPKYNRSAVNPTCGCHKTPIPTATSDVKYMCFCTDKSLIDKNGDKIIVYKCPFQPSKVQLQDSNECMYGNKPSKSSQTNLPLNLLGPKYSDQSSTVSSEDRQRMNICLARESDKKYVFVHEGIRCTQTEISINPKISDPHLSDIEIVCNCAELIGEQFREVSKSSIQSESVCVGEQNADISSPKDNVPNLPKEDKYVQSVLGEYQERDIHPQISIPAGSLDNYRIPIQGTNMTLMVSIDSKSDNDPLQKILNIGELRIAADTVGPMGFAPCSQNSVLCNFAPKTQDPTENFPNNTYPSNKPSPVLTPIFSTGSLDYYDPKNDIGEERLLANYVYPKMERKCPCPETATCGHTCTESAECMNPKTECLESPKLVEMLLPNNSTKKVKCPCPESAKCGGNCGPGAPCMKPKPKPLLRSNTDSGIMAKTNVIIDSPKKPESARGFGASAPNFNANKCKCGASAICGGTCRPDAPCMKDKPTDLDPHGFGASAPSFNLSKCKCGASAKCGGTCGPDAPCMKDKPRDLDPHGFGASAPNFNATKCKCGASAKCRGTCGPDAPCMKDKPRDLDPHGFGASAPNVNVNKCKCGATAKCGGTCGPDAPCMKDKPTGLDPPKQPRPLGSNEPDATKPKCGCPPSANCGQTCDENAPCMKAKALPLGAMKPSTKNEPPRSIASDTDKSNCTTKATLNKRKCVCPPSAKCGQTCDENAPCMKKSQVLPSNTEKSECVPKQLNTPKCVCPPSAGCGQNCDENAPCMNANKPDSIDNCTNEQPKVKLSPKKTMLRYNMNPDDWRDDFVQTEPLGKSQSSTQTEDKSDSSNSAKPRHAESVKSSRNERTPRSGATKDLVLDMIQDITKRYSKKDIEKNQRKKCFKEIMTVLNYLLDIDDNPNPDSGDSDRLPECCEDNTKLPECCEDNNKLPECCEIKESKTLDCVQKADECCGTDDNPVRNVRMAVDSSTDESCTCGSNIQIKDCRCKAIYLDKKMQSCIKHCRSSIVCPPSPCVFPLSTDNPCSTSSDTTTCRVLNRIRKECEKYHQKRCCSSHGGKGLCETSSTTSISCLNCKRTHHCYCKGNRCRGYRSKTCADKLRKKCIAYNLIIQTSESMVSEDAPCDQKCRPLKNIFVKVPPKYKVCDMPFKEACTKVEEEQPSCSPCCKGRCRKSRSASVGSCTDEGHKTTQVYSVREYLERNRPDFVEQCSKRQHCLKSINENSCQASCGPSRLQMVVVHPPNPCVDPCNTYCGGGATTMTCNPAEFCNFPSQYKYEARRIAMRRTVSRDLLSLQLQMQMDDPITLSDLRESDLQEFAKQLGVDIKRKRLAPKFINERDMKKHSEKIYKSLPEVQRKKEEAKKERIKKTNLIMANLFKKNLQKKTLSGAVNISNYSTVVKI